MSRWQAAARILLSPILVVGCLGCGEPQGDVGVAVTWTSFRGPEGRGAAGDAHLPVYWTAEQGIRWRTLVPDGLSQPIVFGDLVFVTGADEVDGPAAREVLGIDRATGEVLWRTELFRARREKMHHQFSSMAMATPAADATSVYVYFGPMLAALDHHGAVRWQQTIDPAYWQRSRYGAASSPLLVDDKVIVFRDKEHGGEDADPEVRSWLAAFARADGALLWKTEWDGTCCSYATPNLVTLGGRSQIVVTTTEAIKGFALDSGEELWSAHYPSVQVVPSSLVDGDLLIATGAVHERIAAGYRMVEPADVEAATGAPLEQLWTMNREVSKIATPVIHDGVLYMIAEVGVVTAMNAETGQHSKKWRIPQGPYHASLIAAADRIYALSARGTVSIWSTEPGFEMLGTFPLPDDTGPYLAMAPAPDCLLARARHALYCIEGVDAPT